MVPLPMPALPPYAHISQESVQCIAEYSLKYAVPELLLHAVIVTENGRTGQAVRNTNGTYDLGVAQINTTWLSHFAKYGVTPELLLNHNCTNIQAAAYILRMNANTFKGDWFKTIVAYNIGPNNWTPIRYAKGYAYATKVVNSWWGFQNWVDAHRPLKAPTYATTASTLNDPIVSKPEVTAMQ